MIKKKILITGASGLIGKAVVEQLLASNNNDIYIVGKTNPFSDKPKIKFINVDLSANWNDSYLPENIDAIIHLAQSSKFREFPDCVENVFNVNTNSTLKLINYARVQNVKHFIYASSAGIYGVGNEKGFDEEQDIIYKNELGFYLASKHCSEVILENYMPLLNVVILRFFFVYGKNQHRSMLIPRLVDFVKAGKPIVLQGDNGLKINPTHVSDAANSIILALKLNGSYKINVAGPETYSLRDIGLLIGKKIGIVPEFTIQNITSTNIVGNISKMKSLLNGPAIKLTDGIDELL